MQSPPVLTELAPLGGPVANKPGVRSRGCVGEYTNPKQLRVEDVGGAVNAEGAYGEGNESRAASESERDFFLENSALPWQCFDTQNQFPALLLSKRSQPTAPSARFRISTGHCYKSQLPQTHRINMLPPSTSSLSLARVLAGRHAREVQLRGRRRAPGENRMRVVECQLVLLHPLWRHTSFSGLELGFALDHAAGLHAYQVGVQIPETTALPPINYAMDP
ncbi:hypothetical protein B0H16DRAFT_1456186 [Mycena metata]|uniref:Uncharacterized protein n=1 Tax=Mycena metata TaxID=1033252 RepID=A0AAD7JC21_9AGAR|nr:hypothetical protein B0H16DRAFT_1456186 [Mycena metata]